jgi:GGDEF domain-containing protein
VVNWIGAGLTEIRRRASVEARVAEQTSRDRRADDEKAAVDAQQSATAGLGRLEKEPPLTDYEHTLVDGERTPSDADRTWSDSDHARADSDLLAVDGERAAADRDPARGDNAPAPGRDVRERAARHREHTARERLDAGTARDAIADARDLAAQTRDRVAAARDLAMAQRDGADQRDADASHVTGAEIVLRAAAQRRRAAQRRAHGAEHLAAGGLDREAAALDREHAARERRQALADREALAHQVAIVETDALTGARTRAAGLVDLDHERDRCRRTSALLVIAYVRIGASSSGGDVRGDDVSDESLARVVARIHDHLRSYDLIVRLDRNDVLCAMSNMPLLTARQRFSAIAAAGTDAITTGFAQLTSQESTAELVESAHGTRR